MYATCSYVYVHARTRDPTLQYFGTLGSTGKSKILSLFTPGTPQDPAIFTPGTPEDPAVGVCVGVGGGGGAIYVYTGMCSYRARGAV